MGHVIAFFSKIDAFIQKRFDSVCFFLMRRFGWRKSFIRYALNAIMTMSFAAKLLTLSRLKLATSGNWFFYGILLALLLAFQHRDLQEDRRAEAKPDAASRSDRRDHTLMKLMSLFFMIPSLLELKYPRQEYVKAGLVDGQHLFPTCAEIIAIAAWLLLAYLSKTPMNPPPEKARESILTPQPAPAKT